MSCRRKVSSGLREMHTAVCVDCGNECEVPFKPDPSTPVFCRGTLVKAKIAKKVLAIVVNQSFLLIL
jgi:CxxC-x17-CxxC domain-containing protein